MPAKVSSSITVEGLPELRRKLRKFAPEAAAGLTAAQKEIGLTVRDMAAHEAAGRGYNQTGDLIAGLKSSVRGTTGMIRDTAKHGNPPYGYPARLEYQDGGSGAFIRPAIEQGAAWITAKMNAAVDAAAERFNRKGIL
jgi:hypothetical protein